MESKSRQSIENNNNNNITPISIDMDQQRKAVELN